MIRAARYLSILAVALLACGPAAAQTPDGETPAEESVCDVLLAPGITPGLYGLCVAYCEAHDAIDPSTAELMCNPADDKILQNYNRKMKVTDPGMPCLKPVCPCWDLDELALIVGNIKYECHEKAKYDANGQLIGLTESTVMYKDLDHMATIQKDVDGTFCLFRFGTIKHYSMLDWDRILACHGLLHQAADPACFQ